MNPPLPTQMQQMWNNRFAEPEFAYGENPNEWFKENLVGIEPGNLLLPAEGEGRNAVYAATQGWFVTAYDLSTSGIEKAAQLARKNNVKFKFDCTSHDDFSAPASFFECIALIYAHMPSDMRKSTHEKLFRLLKPGGTLIVEGFSVNQIGKSSGGPKDIDWLYTPEILQNDFSGLSQINVFETEVTLDEGQYHQGIASVVRLVGTK